MSHLDSLETQCATLSDESGETKVVELGFFNPLKSYIESVYLPFSMYLLSRQQEPRVIARRRPLCEESEIGTQGLVQEDYRCQD
jgi:hypothetical protein